MNRTTLGRRTLAAATIAGFVAAGLVPVAATAADETVSTLFDFESGTSSNIAWGAAGAGVEPVDVANSWPGAVANTHMLSYGFDLTADPFYGGMGFEFAGGQPAQDWSAYDGIQFWMKSDGSASSIQVELLDAATADSSPHDRWDTVVPLDEAGWQLIRLPFESFTFATDFQDDAAPRDGSLDLTFIRGVMFPANAGNAVIKLDEIGLYAGAAVAPAVGVTTASVNVVEGGDAVIPVRLSLAPTSDVTVDFATGDGTAVAGTDYTATSGTLTFAPGERDAQIVVPTTGNSIAEGNRDFTVALTDPTGATLGAATSTVTVRDDDVAPVGALSLLTETIEDFESELVRDSVLVPPTGWVTAQGAGNVPSFERVVDASRPGAADDNDVLEVGLNTASWAVLVDNFTEDGSSWDAQDWSEFRGVGFWMQGTNSGAPMFVDILDNRTPGSTVDDAERFSARFVDDWSGWRFVELPFADFTRKNIGNGAPDDGFTLTEVHGFSIGVEQTSTPVSPAIRIDDLSLVKHQQVVEDFESELVRDSVLVPPTGWVTAQGAGNVPSFERVVDASRPGAADDNDVLEVGLNTASWAVLVDNFTEDGSSWDAQDWSEFRGVGFWMQGTNSGAPMFVDILDNRTPGSTVDDAERFSARFVDDWSGWRFVELPFADFTRKNIGNGAPDDGFTLTEVHGFSIGVEQTSTPVSPAIRIDDLTLVGASDANRPQVINMARAIFTVNEGEQAQVLVRLTRDAETDVTVAYRTEDTSDRTSTEDLSAVADVDYVSTSGMLTIPAGSREGTITVDTIADGKAEVDETFLVRLSDPVGADLNPLAVARVSIVDNDEPIAGLLDDFENGIAGLEQIGDAALSTRVVAASDPDAYAGQDVFDGVLDIAGNGGYSRDFAQPQDWSAQEGVGFWYNGQGDGRSVTYTVEDGTGLDSDPEDWELTWSDEFDGEAGSPANPTNWTYETGGWGWGNDELQYYTNSTDNAAHDGEGNMVITTRAVENPSAAGYECWYGDCLYTSARLITENKVEALHGRIEARAQLPAGEAGIWPAIWSLGNDFRDVGWPRTGEIDIMEYVGKLPEEIFGTIHGPGYSGGNAWHATHEYGENLGGEWMTFAVEWVEGEIVWSVQRDGGEEIKFHSATPEDLAPSEWVFEHPFFFIMNMAVGGNFGGPLADTLTFPQELKVDYLRVFQAPDTAERFATSFTDDEAGWQFVELPFDAFERSSVQPEGAPDDGMGLTAVTGYEFEISGIPAAQESPMAPLFAVAAAAPDGAVSLDKVQVLAEVSDRGTTPGDGGTGGTGSDGGADGTDGTDGTDGADGAAGAGGSVSGGGLAATGGGDGTLAVLIGLLMLAAGAVLVGRRRMAAHAGR
ncbi:carbohydrate binding domain-containing protein (plasmid) [Coraliomargarita sp. W4R53]